MDTNTNVTKSTSFSLYFKGHHIGFCNMNPSYDKFDMKTMSIVEDRTDDIQDLFDLGSDGIASFEDHDGGNVFRVVPNDGDPSSSDNWVAFINVNSKFTITGDKLGEMLPHFELKLNAAKAA